MMDLSNGCRAFDGCNYCTDLKNVANVAKTFRKKKKILQSLQIWLSSQMLQCFLMLRILLCLQTIAKCCRVKKNKNKCVKFAKLAEPSNVAELSKCYSAFKCCKCCKDLKNVANVAKPSKEKKKKGKTCICCEAYRKGRTFNFLQCFKMLWILQSSQEFSECC